MFACARSNWESPFGGNTTKWERLGLHVTALMRPTLGVFDLCNNWIAEYVASGQLPSREDLLALRAANNQ